MAEILITGMEMPPKDDTYGLHLVIYPNGDVWIAYDDKPTGKAKELPPHGRLIDENDLVPLIEDNYGCGVCKNKADEERCLDRCKWAVLLNDIDSLPTVLEASKERE